MKRTWILVCLFSLPLLYALFVHLTQINNIATFSVLCLLISAFLNFLTSRSMQEKLLNISGAFIALTYVVVLTYSHYDLYVGVIGSLMMIALGLVATKILRKR